MKKKSIMCSDVASMMVLSISLLIKAVPLLQQLKQRLLRGRKQLQWQLLPEKAEETTVAGTGAAQSWRFRPGLPANGILRITVSITQV